MFNKPIALITGSAIRIGKSIATHLVDHNWQVVIHYHKSLAEARLLANTLNQLHPDSASIISADFMSETDIKKIIPEINQKFGLLSLLINNAAIFENDNLQQLGSASFHKHQQINVYAPLILSRDFATQAKLLPPTERATNIINILDIYATHPPEDKFLSYALSKASLMQLTKSMASTSAPTVRVNGIAPAVAMINPRQSEQHYLGLQRNNPLHTGSSTAEICHTIDYILSTKSLTGQIINLDGGQSI